MRFRLEEWLKNYKPRVVGTNMVTKKNNTSALRASIGKARAVATKCNRNLGHCVPITDPDTGETYPTRKAFCAHVARAVYTSPLPRRMRSILPN